MKNIILEILKGYKADSYAKILGKFPDMIKWIDDQWKFDYPPVSLSQKIHWALTEVSPLCEHGLPKRYMSYNKGYIETSLLCTKCNDIITKKRKQTTLEKYGVTHIAQLDATKQKQKQTNLKRYGVESYSQTVQHIEQFKKNVHNEESTNKQRKTNLERYGTAYTLLSPKVREKVIQTNLKRYGFEHPMQNEELKTKHRKIFRDKAENLDLGVHKHITEEAKSILYDKEKFIEFQKNNDKSSLHTLLGVERNIINRLFNKYEIVQEYKSSHEGELYNFLNTLGIEIIRNSRKIIPPLELDIYLPDFKLGIEINGNYFHSEYGGNKSKHYHLNKLEKCQEQNIELLQFFEDEWVFKKDICKNIILSKINKNQNKIMARKTQIKVLSFSEYSEFVDQNHLQGVTNSSINLGLEYNNELVCVMSFTKKRMNVNREVGVFELARFVNKQQYSVQGGASKLLVYFIKTYNPKSITTYSDRRYSKGKLYEKLGFSLKHISPPNFWVFKNNYLIRKNRLTVSKFKWKDIENDYDRIWDCGNLVWELKK